VRQRKKDKKSEEVGEIMLDNCYIGVYTLYMRCEKQNKNMGGKEGKMAWYDVTYRCGHSVAIDEHLDKIKQTAKAEGGGK
jgi:hypothetical protein